MGRLRLLGISSGHAERITQTLLYGWESHCGDQKLQCTGSDWNINASLSISLDTCIYITHIVGLRTQDAGIRLKSMSRFEVLHERTSKE